MKRTQPNEFYKKAFVPGQMVVTKSGNRFIIKDRIIKEIGKEKQRHAFLLGIWESYEFLGECLVSQSSLTTGHTQGPDRRQILGGTYQFPCGCKGFIPAVKGENNTFVFWAKKKAGGIGLWQCRVTTILNASRFNGNKYAYVPVNIKTPHQIIRKLMKERNCWRCGQKLEWVYGLGKTPHLHHNHKTGEIFGFTHPRCNANALEHALNELKEENKELKKRLSNAL